MRQNTLLTARPVYTARSCVSVIISVKGTVNEWKEFFKRFRQFLREHRIEQVSSGGREGHGVFHGYFSKNDAEKIFAWLDENGAYNAIPGHVDL